MEKVLILIRGSYLGDLSCEEYDEFWQEEKNNIQTLMSRCSLEFQELECEFQTVVSVIRRYYFYGTHLITLATLKKIWPTLPTETEKKTMYFVAWISDWIGAIYNVLNDIADRKTMRASQPTLNVQFGATNAMSLCIILTNFTYDLMAERFAHERFSIDSLNICRHSISSMSLGVLIDVSCGNYDRKRDLKWLQVRESAGATSPLGVLPVELAFCLAGKSMESEAGKISMRLANVLGSFARALDDVHDVESDTLSGRLNWAFWTAWQKASEEQRSILMDCSSSSESAKLEELVKLYRNLDINKEFEIYASRIAELLSKILNGSSDEVPKRSWRAVFDFYWSIYNGAGRSTWQDQE